MSQSKTLPAEKQKTARLQFADRGGLAHLAYPMNFLNIIIIP
jgi:hypothetical protein